MKYLSATCLAFAILAAPHEAHSVDEWKLDGERSTLSFASTKNESVAEVYYFRSLTGIASTETGVATLEIDVTSLDTGIEIRDQRMLTHLFRESIYPVATVTVSLPENVEALAVGETRSDTVEAEIRIAGQSVTIDADVVTARLADNRLAVSPAGQIVINSEDWGLDQGIGKLKSIAGLDSIDLTVPVTFHLIWTID